MPSGSAPVHWNRTMASGVRRPRTTRLPGGSSCRDMWGAEGSGGDGDGDDRLVQGGAGGRSEQGGARAEVEDAAVTGGHEVTAPVGDGSDADERPVEMDRTQRTVERGARAEVEDAAVGRRQPVPAGRCRRHADDGLVEVDRPRRPREHGVAESEDAAVAR